MNDPHEQINSELPAPAIEQPDSASEKTEPTDTDAASAPDSSTDLNVSSVLSSPATPVPNSIEKPIAAPPPVSFAGLGPFKSILAIAFTLALAFFTVLVEHVRRTKQFGFSTTAEYVTTGLQVLVYLVLFVIGWKLLDRFDRKAVLAEQSAAAAAPGTTNDSAADGADPNDPAADGADPNVSATGGADSIVSTASGAPADAGNAEKADASAAGVADASRPATAESAAAASSSPGPPAA
jgi:hypothetical protein